MFDELSIAPLEGASPLKSEVAGTKGTDVAVAMFGGKELKTGGIYREQHEVWFTLGTIEDSVEQQFPTTRENQDKSRACSQTNKCWHTVTT